LLPDSKKDFTDVLNKNLHYSEWREGGGDLNTYLKGNPIRTDANSLERKSLEMRINIER